MEPGEQVEGQCGHQEHPWCLLAEATRRGRRATCGSCEGVRRDVPAEQQLTGLPSIAMLGGFGAWGDLPSLERAVADGLWSVEGAVRVLRRAFANNENDDNKNKNERSYR